MRFAVSLAAAALALAGCSSQEEANQQDEELKALVFEAAVTACTEAASRQVEGPHLDIGLANTCECGVGKVLRDIPARDFAAISSDEDATAFLAKLQSPADMAKRCTLPANA